MLPNFITQALKSSPITIYGDGQFTRSLCYVQDLVEGMLSVMESNRPDAPGRVYNVGNPEEHTILEYANLVLELIPSSSSRIVYMPPVPDDPSRRRPDITRARTELGWQPRVPLRDGVERTIAYFREVTANS
jgi:nucleoside-diphosphate-sugar epimerase